MLFTQNLLKELLAHLEQVGALEPLVEELGGADSLLQQTVAELRHDYDKTQREIEVGGREWRGGVVWH